VLLINCPSCCCTGKPRRAFSTRAVHSGLSDVSVESLPLPDNEAPVTGAAYSFTGATTSLTNRILTSSKKVTLVRHGLSSWNAESRVQVGGLLLLLNHSEITRSVYCVGLL
jgi:serine/threonine-protein phosphatase PGAM5